MQHVLVSVGHPEERTEESDLLDLNICRISVLVPGRNHDSLTTLAKAHLGQRCVSESACVWLKKSAATGVRL